MKPLKFAAFLWWGWVAVTMLGEVLPRHIAHPSTTNIIAGCIDIVAGVAAFFWAIEAGTPRGQS